MRLTNALSLYAGPAARTDGGPLTGKTLDLRDRKGSSLAFPLLQSLAVGAAHQAILTACCKLRLCFFPVFE